MPNMAAITVKKADGTTDIVWTNMSPSAGDRVQAVWRSQTVGGTVAQRPSFSAWAFGTPGGNQREFKTALVYPILQVASGVTTIIGYCTQTSDTKVLLNAPDVDAGEAVYQGFNLLGSALIKQSAKEGFAPT